MELKGRIMLKVTRANGRVDNIGCIKGGGRLEMLITHIRLWWANWRTRRGI